MQQRLAIAALLLLPVMFGCSAAGDSDSAKAGPQNERLFTDAPAEEPTAADESALAFGEVLAEMDVQRLGKLTIVDEDPTLAEPQLGLLWITSTTDTLELPLSHADGSTITPYEYMATLSSSTRIPERILLQHRNARGDAAPLPITLKALSVSSGSCAPFGWTAYFNGQAAAVPMGGVGAPTHLLNQVTASGTFYGNLSTFANIITGTCFVSQGDGLDDLGVVMQRRLVPGAWSAIVGTSAVLHVGGPNRYLYWSATFSCSPHQRRIRILGNPASDGQAPDVFHASGAWGGFPECLPIGP
jgi:hypothetical protein